MSARTRDGMDPTTRAVSDTLDEYLTRHHGIVTSHTNAEDFIAWLGEQGYEVRTQTETTTTEDLVRATVTTQNPHHYRLVNEVDGSEWRITATGEWHRVAVGATVEDAYRLAYDVMRNDPQVWFDSLRLAIEALADAGLLMTEAQWMQVEGAAQVLRDRKQLLTTARTRPTREELTEYLRKRAEDDSITAYALDTHDSPSADEWDAFWNEHLDISLEHNRRALRIEGRPETIADAVMALFDGQPTVQEVEARALEQAADDHFREATRAGVGNPSEVTTWLRGRAARIRAGNQ